MINDLIVSFINWVDNIYSSMGLFNALSNIITQINTYQFYINDFHYYLRGAYFILGKPMIIYVITVSGTIFIITIIGAIVNIISQFIP